MNTQYDVIVLGTGLTECVLSGLLSTNGVGVLHMDRNNYYGGESASLNLEQLYKKYGKPDEKIPDGFGRSREYNVDVCPKFIMACGDLVKVLLHTKVTRYLDFRVVTGSYVYKDGKIHKVPATAKEAAMSSLMGMFQKARYKSFVEWVDNYDQADPKTWKDFDASKKTMKECFDYWKLDDNTQAFTGHAISLHLDESYLQRPAIETMERIKLYAYSVSRYGSSPYIYPLYGLGGLPEGFSRLSAIHGGVYMLNKPIEKILYNEDGTVKGVVSQGEEVYCKKLLADPTYFLPSKEDEEAKRAPKVRRVGRVARSICILSHPLPNSGDAESAQIIIPGHMIKDRKSDIYVFSVSYHNQVAPEGRYIAVVSAQVETDKPHDELIPGLALLGKIDKEFFFVQDVYHPTDNGKKDNIFISKSYDATSHFDTACADVLDLFERITGKPVDLTISADPEELEKAKEG